LAFGFLSLREVDRDSSSVVDGTGFFSGQSKSEGGNTSSGGTFSPNVRTTRAILRLRVSARLGSIGEVGVSAEMSEDREVVVRGERIEAGGTWESDDDRGTELRRMRGRSSLPGSWDLTASINGTADADSSVEESDMLSSDSLEDEEAWEGINEGRLSELDRGCSMTEHCRWRCLERDGSTACEGDRSSLEAWWSVTGTVLPHDSRRKGVVPRTAPSFRDERITRARCTASSLLVVGGSGRGLVVVADGMLDEGEG
jgi:hypothetical protein